MKNVLSLILLVLMCAAFAQDYPPDIKRILDKGTLDIVLRSDDFPPYLMTNKDGTLTGLDIEIANDIAQNLGVKAVFHRSAKNSDELVETIFEHKADIGLSKVPFLLSYAKKIAFSAPYLITSEGVLVNRHFLSKPENRKKSILEILNASTSNIGILEGSSHSVELVQKIFPAAKQVKISSWEMMVKELKAGSVDAIIANEVTVKTFGITNPSWVLSIESIEIVDVKDFTAAAMPWDYPNLRAWINILLMRNWSDLKVDDYLRKYIEFFETPQAVQTFAQKELSYKKVTLAKTHE